jgi:hypothetical protein
VAVAVAGPVVGEDPTVEADSHHAADIEAVAAVGAVVMLLIRRREKNWQVATRQKRLSTLNMAPCSD